MVIVLDGGVLTMNQNGLFGCETDRVSEIKSKRSGSVHLIRDRDRKWLCPVVLHPK